MSTLVFSNPYAALLDWNGVQDGNGWKEGLDLWRGRFTAVGSYWKEM
jgi:hypothetical protein